MREPNRKKPTELSSEEDIARMLSLLNSGTAGDAGREPRLSPDRLDALVADFIEKVNDLSSELKAPGAAEPRTQPGGTAPVEPDAPTVVECAIDRQLSDALDELDRLERSEKGESPSRWVAEPQSNREKLSVGIAAPQPVQERSSGLRGLIVNPAPTALEVSTAAAPMMAAAPAAADVVPRAAQFEGTLPAAFRLASRKRLVVCSLIVLSALLVTAMLLVAIRERSVPQSAAALKPEQPPPPASMAAGLQAPAPPAAVSSDAGTSVSQRKSVRRTVANTGTRQVPDQARADIAPVPDPAPAAPESRAAGAGGEIPVPPPSPEPYFRPAPRSPNSSPAPIEAAAAPPPVIAAAPAPVLAVPASRPGLASLPAPSVSSPLRSVTPPEVLSKVVPSYPDFARRNKVDGTVELKVVVNAEGKVVEAAALSGPEPLIDAAVQAVRKWKFKPAVVNGVAVTAEGKVSIVFNHPETRR